MSISPEIEPELPEIDSGLSDKQRHRYTQNLAEEMSFFLGLPEVFRDVPGVNPDDFHFYKPGTRVVFGKLRQGFGFSSTTSFFTFRIKEEDGEIHERLLFDTVFFKRNEPYKTMGAEVHILKRREHELSRSHIRDLLSRTNDESRDN